MNASLALRPPRKLAERSFPTLPNADAGKVGQNRTTSSTGQGGGDAEKTGGRRAATAYLVVVTKAELGR